MDTNLPIDISTVFMSEHFHDQFFTKLQPYQPTSERLSLGVKRRLSDMSKLILLSLAAQPTHRQVQAPIETMPQTHKPCL